MLALLVSMLEPLLNWGAKICSFLLINILKLAASLIITRLLERIVECILILILLWLAKSVTWQFPEWLLEIFLKR
jgi:hypothetical protein